MTDPDRDFLYFQCTSCDFDMVVAAETVANMNVGCPLCASDSGRWVAMSSRAALPSDNPEGVDERTPADEA